jgi:ADP-ribose pyrophosphatase YjhB (NUDIX family)
MSQSLFKSTQESPCHLSVGAVVYNHKKEVASHYFKEFFAKDERRIYEDFYILMRETVEENEGLEEAVLRGVREEFGSTGEIDRFIGSLVTKFPRGEKWIEKTTVYFLVKLSDLNAFERSDEDEESVSAIEWRPIDFLIEKMQAQGKKYGRTDLDESGILKRVKIYLQ